MAINIKPQPKTTVTVLPTKVERGGILGAIDKALGKTQTKSIAVSPNKPATITSPQTNLSKMQQQGKALTTATKSLTVPANKSVVTAKAPTTYYPGTKNPASVPVTYYPGTKNPASVSPTASQKQSSGGSSGGSIQAPVQRTTAPQATTMSPTTARATSAPVARTATVSSAQKTNNFYVPTTTVSKSSPNSTFLSDTAEKSNSMFTDETLKRLQEEQDKLKEPSRDEARRNVYNQLGDSLSFIRQARALAQQQLSKQNTEEANKLRATLARAGVGGNLYAQGAEMRKNEADMQEVAQTDLPYLQQEQAVQQSINEGANQMYDKEMEDFKTMQINKIVGSGITDPVQIAQQLSSKGLNVPLNDVVKITSSIAEQYKTQREAQPKGEEPLTKAQINSTVNSIAGAFDNEPIVKEFNVINSYLNTFNSLGDSATDDQARIYAFAKVMDPNSVVRESEYKTVQDYSQALLKSKGINIKRIFTSTGSLTPEAREAMAKTLGTKLKVQKGLYENVAKEYQRQINDAYSGKNRTITDYVSGGNNTQNQPNIDYTNVDSVLDSYL